MPSIKIINLAKILVFAVEQKNKKQKNGNGDEKNQNASCLYKTADKSRQTDRGRDSCLKGKAQ